jgi:hypothetical protein
VTSQPRAFFAVDKGSATTSAALLGHAGGRWRLIAHAAVSSALDVDGLLIDLLGKVQGIDEALFTEICAGESGDLAHFVANWPRLTSRTTPQRRIAVLAGSRRQRRRLEAAALRAGWLVSSGSADEDDSVALARLVLSPETNAVLLGSDNTPAGDEKRHLPDLVALVASATRLRPELAVILAGGVATFETSFLANGNGNGLPAMPQDSHAASGTPDKGPAQQKITMPPSATGQGAQPESVDATSGRAEARGDEDPVATTPAVAAPIPAIPTTAVHPSENHGASPHVLLAPDAVSGKPAGSSLQQVLEGLRAYENDGRLGVARSIASLAYVLDRSIEVVEVGLQGGLRARSEPVGQGHFAVVSSHAGLADASFAPADPSDEVIDGVMAWSTVVQDRHRVMDRLNDLRLTPWGEADGDGAVFRLSAAKAAVARLVEATPEIADHDMPDLFVAAGGIFASLPPAVVALALADLVRRTGVSHLVCDQARLLGPLGAIEDEAERRRILANLADDILVPLGSLIMPSGVKQGRSAGSLRLKTSASIAEIELHPGAVQVVDLPPGRAAKADLDFRDSVRLTGRGHHFSVDVAGGLGGLLVDLRDIPLRMSDRPDSRRAALEAWQRGMWPDADE